MNPMDPKIRKHDLWQGVFMTTFGVLGFVSARWGSAVARHSIRHAINSSPMPRWMAYAIAGLFTLIGLLSLIPAALNVQVPRNIARAMAMLIGAYFMGLADAAAVEGLWSGARFVSVPFVPDRLNIVLSDGIFGAFVLLFSGITVGCVIGLINALRRSLA